MTYAKPEVVVLGEAVSVVEQHPTQKLQTIFVEQFGTRKIDPAYDLDE